MKKKMCCWCSYVTWRFESFILYIPVTYFLINPENSYKLVKGSTISLVMPYPLTLFIHSNYLEEGLILIFLYKCIFLTNSLPLLKKYDYRKFHSQLHSYPFFILKLLPFLKSLNEAYGFIIFKSSFHRIILCISKVGYYETPS